MAHWNGRRVQVVLYPLAWRVFWRGPWPHDEHPIYRWICRVGPVEVRRWEAAR